MYLHVWASENIADAAKHVFPQSLGPENTDLGVKPLEMKN